MRSLYLIAALLFSTVICNAQKAGMFPEIEYLQQFCAGFSLDEKPGVRADTNFIAIWKMKEDVDEHNYFVVERYDYNSFVATYMNRGGSNRTYENFGVYFSKIGNVDFITVPCYDRKKNTPGYFFLKVTDIDPGGWHMTLALVTDPTLKNITSREALRAHITKNMNTPGFFSKPVHFDKKLPLMYCK